MLYFWSVKNSLALEGLVVPDKTVADAQPFQVRGNFLDWSKSNIWCHLI